jgi:hypothetical protein
MFMDHEVDFYESLMKDMSSLKDAQTTDDCGLDQFLLPDTIKVASLGDLSDFFRASADTLVHKAQKDLWQICEDKEGGVMIKRLFDPSSNKPIKV